MELREISTANMGCDDADPFNGIERGVRSRVVMM
jgi:hypothetical protein